MSKLNVDHAEVRKTNYGIPSLCAMLDGSRRELEMLKWRMPDEVMDRKEIKKRMESVIRRIDKAEKKLEDIYRVVGSSMSQYIQMEETITLNANRFE